MKHETRVILRFVQQALSYAIMIFSLTICYTIIMSLADCFIPNFTRDDFSTGAYFAGMIFCMLLQLYFVGHPFGEGVCWSLYFCTGAIVIAIILSVMLAVATKVESSYWIIRCYHIDISAAIGSLISDIAMKAYSYRKRLLSRT